MIEVKQLRKEYGDVVALGGVSFEVPRGQVLGFLGPNGAGKSTTIKILTTYIAATSGDATLAGYSVADEPIEVRRRVGYLPEHAPLYLDMTVFDYLRYAASARELGGYRTQRRAIARVVDICSLFEVAGRRIAQLSKGFRQRVGLAQAMLHDPEVLVLDEPTSGLDPIQIQEIRGVIRRMGEERTVIFSTHIIPEVEMTADRVLVIDRGSLVADGSPAELRRSISGEALVARVRGKRAPVESLIRDTLGSKVQLEFSEHATGVLEVKVAIGTSDGVVDHLAAALSGSGQLLELRSQTPSLEDAFFRLVGRRSESSTSDDKSAA